MNARMMANALRLLADALESDDYAPPPARDPYAAVRALESRYRGRTYVYFLRQGEDGPIKIGFTRSVVDRVANLQGGNPYRLQVLGIIPGGDEKLEREIHASSPFIGCTASGSMQCPRCWTSFARRLAGRES